MTRTKSNRRKVAKKPRELPKITINWTYVLAPPGVFAILVTIFFTAQVLLDHPFQQLYIEGRFQRVTPIQIEEALVPGLNRGFLSANLGALQHRVESLDWVEHVEIVRQWPDALVVRVVEHQAAARWGEMGLLNTHGELFTNGARHLFPELPRLAGPEGSELEVAKRYLRLRGRLTEANLALETLIMDERGAWKIELESGQQIRIGRRNVDQRLDRLFRVVAPILAAEFDRVSHVDLRYTNGFSVGWYPDSDLQPVVEVEVFDSG
ncbi:MAG: cell division protein FtsQ/DivIB [Pseudomonadota bacterium]|nr:cell division protein FtsQ/DivIB [Pseudomonadota bacterium]